MYYIRVTDTASKAKAVQVVRYENRKLIVEAHLGSAHNEKEQIALKKAAQAWIEKALSQRSLFPESQVKLINLVPFDQCRYLGIRYLFSYEVLTKIYTSFGWTMINQDLLKDLIIIRILEPASKLRSLKLLDQYFGLAHKRSQFYRLLPEFVKQKEAVETQTILFAQKHLGFDFSLVFYDVTTLYFESFDSDDLRKPGFSKDNKVNQPQVVIGLIVNSKGFPISYEIFEGNKFEGHTLLPVITAFRKKQKIDSLTVVADAAMISLDNIQALKLNNLSYIVGARLGNLPKAVFKEIKQTLKKTDGESIRLKTEYGDLICQFSQKRYQKNKREMEKQLTKAKNLIKQPQSFKRTKFLKSEDRSHWQLNQELITKTKDLLGIKGYYANLDQNISNQTIINQYHQLWQIEQAFRMAKNDLEVRPIYHFKEEAIKAHLLICFMALVIGKYLEITTGKSIRQIIDLLLSVTDARIFNRLTNQEFTMRSELNQDLKEILRQLNLSY